MLLGLLALVDIGQKSRLALLCEHQLGHFGHHRKDSLDATGLAADRGVIGGEIALLQKAIAQDRQPLFLNARGLPDLQYSVDNID